MTWMAPTWMKYLRCSLRRRDALAGSDGATLADGPLIGGEAGVGVGFAGGAGDFLRFFRSWVTNPLRVAAIAPSGDPLARLMTKEIEPFDGPIIELGPGTGVFTRALLARGIAESELTLIEYGGEFLPGLQRRFPQARIVQMDAAELSGAGLFDGRSVGAVVSGLPLLSMSPAKVEGILAGAFTHLRDDGAVYQFTYGPRCPVPRPILERLGLEATHIGGTVRNLPPAAVYRITRKVG
jgi:phosphatidylethanolamine/phosphatidyl-N-methylethanolamine N-methyltransferase